MDNSLINMVVFHLLKFRKITSKDAFEQYGITRLSSIIFELRGKGYPIETTMVEGINRWGNPTRYGVYSLPSDWNIKDLEK